MIIGKMKRDVVKGNVVVFSRYVPAEDPEAAAGAVCFYDILLKKYNRVLFCYAFDVFFNDSLFILLCTIY